MPSTRDNRIFAFVLCFLLPLLFFDSSHKIKSFGFFVFQQLHEANLKFLLALSLRMATSKGLSNHHVDVIDIRREELDGSLLKVMLKCLDPDDNGPRTLPSLLLYDGRSNHAVDRTLQLIREQRLV